MSPRKNAAEANQRIHPQELILALNQRVETPNFYMTRPYLDYHDKVECYRNSDWVWAQEGAWTLFPPLPIALDSNPFPDFPEMVKKIWCDYEGCLIPSNFKLKFFDHEYIYSPESFARMEGGSWATFRKNVRKFPTRYGECCYTEDCPDEREVYCILGDYLENKPGFKDAEYLVKLSTLSHHPDVIRKFLYNSTGILLGWNIVEKSGKNWVFRYCVHVNIPFLDEYMRFLMYSDSMWDRIPGAIVNDGGTVGNKGLEIFKDKLNPIEKRVRNSWYKQ